jgi:hypothetical protein
MTNYEETLINRLLLLKDKLTFLEENMKLIDPKMVFDSIHYFPINKMKLETIKDYPLEYFLFMEFIGPFEISQSGCFMLEVTLPQPLNEVWSVDRKLIDNQNLKIVAHTDNDDIFHAIYDSSALPILPFINKKIKISFLDLVEKKIEECISNLK